MCVIRRDQLMGRPTKPVDARASERFCVALRPETVALIREYASLQGELQASPIVRRVLERVFDRRLINKALGMGNTPSSSAMCYGDLRQPSASTMRYVLTGSPHDTGVRFDGADSPSLDRSE